MTTDNLLILGGAGNVGRLIDRLLRANVGSVIKIDWGKLDVGPATIDELARELLGYQPLEYRGGAWQPASAKAMWIPRHMTFGREFGRQPCAPMFLEEMRALPSWFQAHVVEPKRLLDDMRRMGVEIA